MADMNITLDEAKRYEQKAMGLMAFIFVSMKEDKLDSALSFVANDSLNALKNEIFLSRVFIIDLLLQQNFGRESKEYIFTGDFFFSKIAEVGELDKDYMTSLLLPFAEVADDDIGEKFLSRLQKLVFDEVGLEVHEDYSPKNYMTFKLKWFLPETTSFILAVQKYMNDGMPAIEDNKRGKAVAVQTSGCLLPIMGALILCILFFILM